VIANPIMHKEVLSSLRTFKAALVQAVFLLVLAWLVWLFWPEGSLLAVIAIGELLMVAVFAPAFAAASITVEKECKTWELLLATRMQPWQIALGKIAGSLAFLLLLVVSGLPALAAMFLLGGVRGQEILVIAAVLVLTMLYLGMIGLLVSSVTCRSSRAVIFTYGVMLVLCFAVAAPVWPVTGDLMANAQPGLQKLMHALASLSPLQAMLSVVMPDSDYCTPAAGMPAYWKMFIPISAVVILVTAAMTLRKLSQPLATQPICAKRDVVERGKISARTFLFIIDPLKRKRNITWWQNPILMKEFRTRSMLQAQWLLRAVIICFIVALLVMILVTLSVQAMTSRLADMTTKMAAVVSAMIVALTLLVGPSLAGGAFSADRETGVWDLMRTTRLGSWRMVSGKFQSSVIPLLLFAVATLPALLILLYFNAGLWTNIVKICCVIGMTILFVSAVGVFFSAISSRTSTATALTYAVVVGLGLLALLAPLGRGLFPQGVAKAVFTCNPVAAAMDAAGLAAMRQYGLLLPHLRIMGAATVGLLAVTTLRIWQLRRPT